MPFTRLPESVQTLYAELLDQLRSADAEAAIGASRGSFVSKQIRGRTYWYLQKSEGSAKRQIYLGVESPALLEQMRAIDEQRTSLASDEKRRRELVAMLAAGGMFRESAATGTVLQALAAANVFRAGGVLVGTQAFICIAHMLGASFDQTTLRTADIDVAHDGMIVDSRFFAMPQLDLRQQSIAVQVRGRELRVDFLMRDRTRGHKKAFSGLDYLVTDAVDAAAIAGSGVLVNVPTPGRFALHKLWVASERPVSEAAKAKKDVRQATALLELLLEDRPEEITSAYEALRSRRSMLRRVVAQLKSADVDLEGRLKTIL